MMQASLLSFHFFPAVAMVLGAAVRLFGEFCRMAAPVFVSALWQGMIVAAGLAICMRLAQRASAGLRFGIWAAGFAALVCLPFLSLFRSTFMAASETNVPVVDDFHTGSFLRLDPRWSLLIGAVWLMASLARMAGLFVHALRLRNLWKSARPIEDVGLVISPVSEARPGAPGIFQSVGKLQIGNLRRDFEICTTTELDRPAVIGFFAPRILIPEWLFGRLSAEELEHVVLHEWEHLRRGDDWINLAQKLCLALFPLNPALAWMDRRLASEREMACDEGVVRMTQAPRAYAASLASLAERGLKHRAELLSLGAWQRRAELVERVHRILRRREGLSPIAARALAGVLSCGLALGSIELSHAPQLVAFAPEPQTAAQESAIADARYVGAGYGSGTSGRSAAGFHAVDAVAVMPATGANANPSGNRRKATNWSDEKHPAPVRQSLANAGHEVLLRAEMPSAHEAERDEQAQTMWIVFTAWQQVDGRRDGPRGWKRFSGVSQDYDNPAAEDGAEPSSGTITQLIFRIDPSAASAGASRETQQQSSALSGSGNTDFSTSNTTSSESSGAQPAAISLHDGWFVFQL